MGTQKNRLNETVILSTQNVCYYWWVRKHSQFKAHYFYLDLWKDFTRKTCCHQNESYLHCYQDKHYMASMWENISSGVGEQQRRRPSCTWGQCDQCLCYLLIGKNHIKTCYKRNFTLLASLCSWGDWLSLTLVLSETLKTGFVMSRPIPLINYLYFIWSKL